MSYLKILKIVQLTIQYAYYQVERFNMHIIQKLFE